LISILAALGGILNLFPILLSSMAVFAGQVHRVGELEEVLLATIRRKRQYDTKGTVRHGDMVRLANVTIRTPRDHKLLFEALNILVQPPPMYALHSS
jgi:ABC-type uncharacterized transport system fused permease/ATPase subunit